MGAARSLMALLMVLLMVAGTAGFGVAALAERTEGVQPPAAYSPGVDAEAWKRKVDPALLGDEVYAERGHLPVGTSVAEALELVKSEYAVRLPSELDGKARVIVYYVGGEEALEAIKSIATVTSGVRVEGMSSGYVIAWADRSEVEELARLPYVVSIVPDQPQPLPEPRSDANYEAAGDFNAMIYGAVDIMGATYAWQHGYKGEGVKVAIVDTGLDMGSSDLGLDALARDAYGRPLLFDADENGLVLTLNPAPYAGNGSILVQPITIGNVSGIIYYDGWDGGVYVTNYTLMLVYDTGTGNYTVLGVPVVNSYYGVPPEIGNVSVVNFGLVSQNLFVGRFFVWYLVPIINVDLDGDGTFDGVYTDLSTAYFLFTYALYQLGYGAPANFSLFDLSFADEQLLNYNNPIAARDFTGDGVNDFSLGAIAGAFNDVNGIFDGVYSFDWLVDFEDIGYIVPGYDQWYGQWVAFEFDFHSHGTYCAHVVGSRGKVPRPLGYGDMYYNLTGVAPAAKIGGATALWNGNVIIAQLYLSGFELVDPANFTWAYTGATQADVISNSWGSSYLIVNGYASDADPSSLWENFITLYTGTVIVHAAGNGGPGYGTVTMAGTATSVVTVGASTEFLYRPFYGYLPGAYYQVVSWSDRGPTQLAYAKPDVVNIGSFAWAVGRVIDGLGNGVYAFDLFGGTSEATPMTAGAVALLIQALRDNGYPATPAAVKTLLKTSARDLGYDPFTQGAGHVDLVKAIDTILQGGVVVKTDAPQKVLKYFDDTMAAMLGASKTFIHSLYAADADTSLYFGVVKPGAVGTANVSLVTPAGVPVQATNITAKLVTLVQTGKLSISKVADLSKAVLLLRTPEGYKILPVPNEYVAIVGDYVFVRMDKLGPGSRLLVPLTKTAEAMLANATLAQINAYYPYKYMDPYGRNGNYAYYMVMGVEASYWIDYNNDSLLLPQETARIQYDIRLGNAFHVQIGNPAEAFALAEKEALEYLQKYYGINATGAYTAPVLDFRFFVNAYYGSPAPLVLPIKTVIELYNEQEIGWNLTVAPTETGLQVSVEVPSDAKPGVYEGYLKLCTDQGKFKLPFTVAVPIVVEPGKTSIAYGSGEKTIYKNYQFFGALDQGWRPETGDWRIYPVLIESNAAGKIVALKIGVSWSNPASSFDVALNGPGYNFWGVANYSYVAWIDAATVAAKISAVSRFIGATGVYTYFDYPSPRYSEIIAPVASTLLDPDASVYWIVVHQIFQAYTPDNPAIIVTPLTLTDNVVTVKPGKTSYKFVNFYSANLGPATQLRAPIVVPLTGGSPTDISVTVLPANLTAAPMKSLMVLVTAGENATGVYMVLVPYLAQHPSVIWGGVANGNVTIIYSQPTLFYVQLIVSVG